MTRALLYGFGHSPPALERLQRAIRAAEVTVCGLAARAQYGAGIQKAFSEIPFFEESLPFRHSGEAPKGLAAIRFSSVQEETIRLLLDRETTYQNQLHASVVRLDILSFVLRIFDETRPECVFYSDVPHSAFSYLLYRVAKQRGIPAIFMKRGPAPHLFLVGNSVSRIAREAHSAGQRRFHSSSGLSPRSEAYVQTLKRSYSDAKPEYMRAQEVNHRLVGKLRRVASSEIDILSVENLRKVVAHAKRQSLLSKYESSANGQPDLAKPFVAVFLHLQPERTTIPEGGIYAQQFLVVEALAASLPAGWKIYVREHPSTFRAGPKLMRGPWFYDALQRLPNTELVSTKVDAFKLIDSARCVATVTGTVGLEAIARGVPAIVFGSAPYLGCSGAMEVARDTDVERHLSAIADGFRPEEGSVERYLAELEASPWCISTELGHSESFHEFWASGKAQAMGLERAAHLLRTREEP